MKAGISTVLLIACSILSGFSQDLLGLWNGTAKSPDNKEITFVFLFENGQDGYTTTMAVPTFEVSGIKPKATTLKEGKLFIDGSNLGMKYEGTFNESTQQIEGTYTEGGMVLTLALNKGNLIIEVPNRPQEPVKPYPYYEEEVVFENKEANLSLSGTLTRPDKNGEFPVVILISGSGPQDRDESWKMHKPFWVLADYLTRQGLAVLRYDDRGFGKSTGDHSAATTEDFAKDVLSAIDYLKTRTDINSKQIGLIGHSEGGIIAPLAANQTEDVAFIVLLASTGIPGSELSVMQAKSFRPFPVPDEAAFEQHVRIAIKIAASDQEISLIKTALKQHHESYLVPLLKSLGVPEQNIAKLIADEIEDSVKPWRRYFFNYNPADEIEHLAMPVLSLNGSKDTQVEAKINQEGIRNALIKANNKDYKIVELENLNHLFQECETGEISEYKKIEQTISPIALEEISTWILVRL
jgi:pimeloyl-ACP methyl ester carboxylesterase